MQRRRISAVCAARDGGERADAHRHLADVARTGARGAFLDGGDNMPSPIVERVRKRELICMYACLRKRINVFKVVLGRGDPRPRLKSPFPFP